METGIVRKISDPPQNKIKLDGPHFVFVSFDFIFGHFERFGKCGEKHSDDTHPEKKKKKAGPSMLGI